MKVRVMLSLVLLAGVFLSACEQESVEKNYITERIQYDVKIKGDDPEADWWIDNIVGPDREKFVKHLIEKAQNGEIKAYDYFNNPLTPEQVNQIGVDTLVQTLRRTVEPYDEYDTMIITKLVPGHPGHYLRGKRQYAYALFVNKRYYQSCNGSESYFFQLPCCSGYNS